MSEPAEEKIARLTRERDEMATQASACAEEVDRVRAEIGAVQAENERLRERLREEEARADRFARHMRENGDLVAEIGGELALAGCRIAALTSERDEARTALAESERKRAEAEEERKAECDRSKKISAAFERYCKSVLNMQDFHRGALDCGIQRDAAARIWSSAQAHRRDRLAFTPTQETPHVES
ncbi:hypothetical protein NS228_06060 [Methylobacterium indicum]|uniref:hypothetical protein n=1 Tax=Methylobacterium indicum TaxID=1775910 RepID=UPI000734A762|nr:hypothetical protein [Methylobacterium indicum]KTS30885.1 hypothetical protein NS229_14770 [Methylobacterium indicum]KTS41527.1 hypothetical protein NS228_06060 [Methylobacterium indicum]KTS52419.1 hypothetical protein NS230_09855 [Methylobacterium indicum]